MSVNERTEAALINATRRIAREEILPRFRSLARSDVESKRDPDDLVTVADRLSEERLTEEIASIWPQAAIVGEEAVSADKSVLTRVQDADLCVVIDPIDGTWNYANGLGTFGVILAVIENGRTVWGGLYDPLGDDWIIGRAGKGTWFRGADGAEIAIRIDGGVSDAGDAFGLVPLYLFHGDERKRLASLYPEFRRVGSLRCSCHEYRLLSQGRADFSLSTILNVWDHAAGQLIVSEAGGVSRLLNGTEYDPTMTQGRLLVARSEALWESLAERLRFLS